MGDSRVFQINVSQGGVPKRPRRQIRVGFLGAAEDGHDDAIHHGGTMRALCLYSLELVLALQAEGHPIFPGSTGENVTLSGMDWSIMQPGTRLSIGDELQIELTDYAAPCNTIRESFINGDYGRISQTKHPGWSRMLARVIKPGRVGLGDLARVGDG
jgi:MOSC domain-containing protein YiiM